MFFVCCSTYATDDRVLNAFFTTLQQIATRNFTYYQTQHQLLSSHYPATQHIVAPFNNNRPRNHAKRTDANQISAPTKVQPKPACCGKHNFPVRFARTLLDTRAANVTSARHKSLRPTSFVCPLFRVVWTGELSSSFVMTRARVRFLFSFFVITINCLAIILLVSDEVKPALRGSRQVKTVW